MTLTEFESSKLRGLIGRAALDADAALHLPRCRSVHTFGMRFALDLVWLDGDGRPVRIDRGVGPRRVRTCLRARSVLECAAGRGDAFAAARAADRVATRSDSATRGGQARSSSSPDHSAQ